MHLLLLNEKEWSLNFCSVVVIQLLDKHLAMETVITSCYRNSTSNGMKLRNENLGWIIRKNILMARPILQWKKFSKTVVEALFLGTF